jgi:hypothetical protein
MTDFCSSTSSKLKMEYKVMKKVNLAACAIAATLCTSPLALAVTPSLRVNQQISQVVYISGDTLFFGAESDVDQSGAAGGGFKLNLSVGNHEESIYCNGPEYAKIVSVNPTNGDTIIKLKIDPASPSCTSAFAYPWRIGPVTVNVVGKYNGGNRASRQDTETEYLPPTPDSTGGTFKRNSQSEEFPEIIFTGSITSSITGAAIPNVTFPKTTGSANNSRFSIRQKVK